MNRRMQTGAAAGIAWLLLLPAGCGDRVPAPELAKAGAATANALASYYDSLVQNTLDTWELETIFGSITGVPLEKEQETLLDQRVQALKTRAGMGRELAAAYAVFGKLGSSRAAAEAGDAAGNLGASLQSIPQLPKSPVQPSTLLGGVAAKISGLRQARQVAHGNELIAEMLEKIHELFRGEQQAYQSICRERNATLEAVAAYLVKNKLVTAWPLVEKLPQLIGLPWADQGRAMQDEKLAAAALALAGLRARKMDLAAQGAAEQVSGALALMISKHTATRPAEAAGLDDVLGAVRNAQQHLDEIAKLRAATGKGGAHE